GLCGAARGPAWCCPPHPGALGGVPATAAERQIPIRRAGRARGRANMSAELLPASLRDDFPLLGRPGPAGRPVINLDSAATALKPRAVIDAVVGVLTACTANVHRATHYLGDEATELYEGARRKVARLIGAESH